MKSFCILSVTLALLLHGVELVSSYTFHDLEHRIEKMEQTLATHEAELAKPVIKCESGLLVSNYCNPATQDCFNGKKTAQFNLNFQEAPALSVGLIHLDLYYNYNTRIATTDTIANNHDPAASGIPYSAYEATADEVSVTFHCWSSSKCYQAAVSWMACGPVSD